MTTVLPEAVSYGTVIGSFLHAAPDSDDIDLFPDSVPAVGTINFKPNVSFVRIFSPKRILVPQTITATLDETGSFEVILIATENLAMSPSTWAYTVSFNIQGMTIPSFPMTLEANQTLDLYYEVAKLGLVQ